MFDLKLLFVFIQWIDYSYGRWYEKRAFDPKQVPCVQQALSRKEVQAKEDAAKQELAKELSAKTERIQELERQLEESRAALSVQKAPRPPMPDSEMDISEYETRQRFIDLDLRLAGWDVDSEAEVVKERKVTGMEDHEGRSAMSTTTSKAETASRWRSSRRNEPRMIRRKDWNNPDSTRNVWNANSDTVR